MIWIISSGSGARAQALQSQPFGLVPPFSVPSGSEIRFLSQFFEHDGLRDYIAYRRVLGTAAVGRSGRPAGLVERTWVSKRSQDH